MFNRSASTALALLLVALHPSLGMAQEAVPTGSGELVAPTLLEGTTAPYPREARDAAVEGTVLLQLTIDAEGSVREAEVLEPLGHGLDEAAREAALVFRFAPARRGELPITARIRYPFVFKLPLAPELLAAPAPVTTPDAAPALVEQTATPPGASSAPVGTNQDAAAPDRASSTANATKPVEVTIRGSANDAQRLQQSAEAVNVVDTRIAKQQSADLGEVLARTQGIAVRRDGGLGSGARFSLNGLYDDQVRFFLDGVPLDLSGYPFGIVNVPVNLVERIEVYRGVVPVRLGADALGGAVNLVTDQNYDKRAGASYQVGSFGTHRVTLDGRYRHEPTGFVVGAATFLDSAKNDYEVDVEIPNDRGRLSPATVRRFHDAYRAYGGELTAGIVERPWARRLLITGFGSTYDKELQHNTVMTIPYGEVTYGESVVGATGRYENELSEAWKLELVASYAYRVIDFEDKSAWIYDWRGDRIRERPAPGEINSKPSDQSLWQHSIFGRSLVEWKVGAAHSLRASATSQFSTRTGDERIQADPDARDPLTAKQDLLTFVSGVEHELSLFEERLSNVLFLKDYVYRADAEEPLPRDVFRTRETKRHSVGVGDSLRFRFTSWLLAKASYEYATRLPRPDEVFGNGVLVQANLELEPEVSHNGNLGPRLELVRTPLGDFTLDVNAFLRESDKLIVLLGNDRFFSYQNVYKARGLGLENALSWVSPGRWVSLDGMLTWQEVTNASKEGAFGDFEGDRIPNRPYLFGSWGARLRFAGMPSQRDTVEPFYSGRYVHEFYRGWESQGLRKFKQVVDAQTSHAAGVTWIWSRKYARTAATFEVDNLTDAKLFDNFGVQRPGRAFYAKLTGEL